MLYFVIMFCVQNKEPQWNYIITIIINDKSFGPVKFHSVWWSVDNCLSECPVVILVFREVWLVQYQDIQDYWNRDEVLETPFFRKTMSRNRFLLIMSLFHLNNNENQSPQGQDGYDSIFKIRWVYDHFRTKFEELYYLLMRAW